MAERHAHDHSSALNNDHIFDLNLIEPIFKDLFNNK